MKTTNTKRTRCPTRKNISSALIRITTLQIIDAATSSLKMHIPRVSYLNIKLFSRQQKTLHRVCDIKSAGLRSEQWIGTTQIADLRGRV